MKKQLTLLAFFLVTCLLTACGTTNDTSPTDGKTDTSANESQADQKVFVKGFVDNLINTTLKTSVDTSDSETIAQVEEAQAAAKTKGSDGFTILNDTEKGLKINMGYSFKGMKPQVFYKFFFDNHCVTPPAEGEEAADCKTTVTGDLKTTIAYNGSTVDPQLGLILHTDNPLVFDDAEGGAMDGATLGFDNFTLWFSLKKNASQPIKSMSGKVVLNGTAIDLAELDGLNLDSLLSGDISGLLTKLTTSKYLPGLLDGLLNAFVVPQNVPAVTPAKAKAATPKEMTIYDKDGLLINMGYTTLFPPSAYFLFVFDEYCLTTLLTGADACTLTTTGALNMRIKYDLTFLTLTFNTPEPMVFSDTEEGVMNGSTLVLEDLTIKINPADKNNPLKDVSGKAYFNDMELDPAMFESLDIAAIVAQFSKN